MINTKNHIEKNDLHNLGIYNNYKIRDIKEDRLNLIQTQTKSKTFNQPIKTIKNQKNIINNRLLLKPDKKFKIEPDTKARQMKSRPVESEYNDKLVYSDSTSRSNYWYPMWMQYYDPYVSLYDLPVLIPILNDELGPESTYVKSPNHKYKTRSYGIDAYYDANTNYAIFGDPIPIIVRRNNKEKKTIENFKQNLYKNQ